MHKKEPRRLAVGLVAVAAFGLACTAGPRSDVEATSVRRRPEASSTSAHASSNVVFVDVRTREVRPLPAPLTAFEEAADFRRSPDGSRFVFRAAVGGTVFPQLFLANVDGSSATQLTHEPLAATDGRWSPDGYRIVFLSGGFLAGIVKTIDVATGRVRAVTGVPEGAFDPSFGPDGRTILYSLPIVNDRGAWHVDLWTVPTQGGTPRRLVRFGGYGAYSPDGSRIAYHRTAPQPSAFCGICWWIEQGLSIADVGDELGVSHGGMIAPPQAHATSGARWSPSGSLVMHTGPVAMNGNAEVVVRDLRSGRLVRLGVGSWPTWFDDRTVVVTRCDRGTLRRPCDLRT